MPKIPSATPPGSAEAKPVSQEDSKPSTIPAQIGAMWKKPLNRLISGICFLVVLSWTIWIFVEPGTNVGEAGQFGDKFGALNTLFTGLAFVGVIAAFWHEREGTADREREHKELIAAMKAQAEAVTRASQTAARIAQLEELHRQWDQMSASDRGGEKGQENKDLRAFLNDWLKTDANTEWA